MDCCAFCTAQAYAIKPLYEVMRVTYKTTLYRDVVHVVIDKNDNRPPCDVFFFPYGVSVFWGLENTEGLKFLKEEAAAFEQNPKADIETDIFTYVHGETHKIADDEISLPNHDILTKLAISQGIAQSVKLGTFETSIQKTFKLTKQIPEDLAKYGKISLSRKEIRRKMGELFIERNSINLHMDILDTPEFFWEYPELEPLYIMTANYLDIRTRVEVLNQRLNVIHGLFEMLGTELNHLHSSRLELTIVCLIVIEVLISLLINVLHII
ncbi:MAG: RMD1 family protein [Parachlamydiaceae bacterium]